MRKIFTKVSQPSNLIIWESPSKVPERLFILKSEILNLQKFRAWNIKILWKMSENFENSKNHVWKILHTNFYKNFTQIFINFATFAIYEIQRPADRWSMKMSQKYTQEKREKWRFSAEIWGPQNNKYRFSLIFEHFSTILVSKVILPLSFWTGFLAKCPV